MWECLSDWLNKWEELQRIYFCGGSKNWLVVFLLLMRLVL